MASIRQMASGKWQAQVRRRGIKPVVRSFGNKTDATRWARQLEAELDRGVFVDRSEAERTSLAVLIDRYLAEVTPAKKSASRERLTLSALRNQFGAFSPVTLRPTHISEYRDARIAAGLAGATVVKELNTLSHVLDVAIKDWGIALPMNPAKQVRRPQVARGRDRRLMPGEEERLLAACGASRAPMLASAVQVALETGMRMGEILALDWRHIDLASRVATLIATKNGEVRQVPLSTAAATSISRLPRNLTDSRVFWTWARADSLENAWRRAVSAAGLVNFRFHDLRHEAVSRLFERGFNPMEVASISGHKTLQMLKRYTHLKAHELVKKLA
ncbi:MAG: site-specific integrase [Betaproteobacteria bacterium]|nr:site-specific integrase [Betaproteobacteria bacterium]